jgi:hypothetical protein
MTTDPASADVELPPGYHVEPTTGAWLSLPWTPASPNVPSLLPGILRWIAGDGEPRIVHHLTGEPWSFTRDQLRFLHNWYGVRPDGRWLWRSGVFRRSKGAGKDPMGAVVALIELAGPCRFSEFRNGVPVGEPHRLALVQVGANSEAQAADLLRVANAMVSPALASEIGWDPGIHRSQTGAGSRIELLTRSERSAEGDPCTAGVLNETHWMTHTSGGQGLAGVVRRNVGKSPGGAARVLELTNAHLPGEGSVAEDSYEAWQAQVAGKTRRADILYDSREAPPHLRLHVEEELCAGIAAAYADSPWTDQERIRDEAQDPRVTAADSVRFYFNALPTNETAWVDPRRFDALAAPGLIVADRDPLALFLDCSKSTDATVLCGCRVTDGHVLALGGWQRPHGDRGTGWLAPRHEVDAAVRVTFDRYDVQWFSVDPSPARDDETEALYWAPMVDEWHRRYRDVVLLWATPGNTGSAVAFDMRLSTTGGVPRNRMFTEAAEQTAADIDELGTLTWDGDPMLRQHVHNARRRPNQWGVTLGKATRTSSKLVDYAVAMVGARMGRRLLLNSGKTRERQRSGVVW